MTSPLRTGTVLGTYRVVAPLGVGGMGEVFRAHDTKLDRAVALKILPSEVTHDADRLRRFVHEAKAASSLSHPNIVVVHDIGQAVPVEEGSPPGPDAAPVHYIAMELVEGATLRQLFADRSIEPRTLLAHLAQAAEGLAKAHAAGIVHRDLKPENIMVSRDGFAKVLDFGLAKLAEVGVSGSALTAAPAAARDDHTREGLVLGTIGYMSPEQAQGRPVDHRTDLFAFGCLLYEAATGRRPFPGESNVDVLHAIVRGKPTPVEQIAPAIPRALVRVIRRCLAKDPDRRYQSMKDLALELHDMVDEWEELALPSGPVSSGSALSAAVPPARAGLGRGAWIAVAVAVAAIATAAVFLWLRPTGAGSDAERAGFQGMRILPATSNGRVGDAAISPDGRYLVYTRAAAGGTGLWLRQLATGSDAQLLPPQGERRLGTPVFTPDGSYVDYRLSDEGRNYSTLYRMPVLGGAARKVLFDVDSAPGYSPDGGQLAFVRGMGREGEQLVVAGFDGRGERVLASREGDRQWFDLHVGPVWSPDGRSIAVSGADYTGELRGEVVLVDVASGRQQPLGDAALFQIAGLDWPPGGDALLVAAVVKGESFSPQILRLSVPDGVVSRVTNDTAAYQGVSSSGDGTKLASVQSQSDAALWRRSLRGTGADEQLTFSSRELIVALERATDGTLFYAVRSGADAFVARLGAEGGAPLRLTPPGFVGADPQVSRDGRRLVIRRLQPDGRVALATMDSDGNNVREVTTRGALSPFALHPDEPWLVAVEGEGLWRVPLDGGEAELLVRDPRATPVAFSPSGDRLAYASERRDAQGLSQPVLRIIPAAGGEVLAELDRPRGVQGTPRWSPDGRSIVARVQQGASSALLSFPLDNGPPSLLTDLSGLEVREFVLAADGESITYVRVDTSSDAVVIESFR